MALGMILKWFGISHFLQNRSQDATIILALGSERLLSQIVLTMMIRTHQGVPSCFHKQAHTDSPETILKIQGLAFAIVCQDAWIDRAWELPVPSQIQELGLPNLCAQLFTHDCSSIAPVQLYVTVRGALAA